MNNYIKIKRDKMEELADLGFLKTNDSCCPYRIDLCTYGLALDLIIDEQGFIGYVSHYGDYAELCQVDDNFDMHLMEQLNMLGIIDMETNIQEGNNDKQRKTRELREES